MNIFVTGATGFLGYHFVKEALKQGHNICCLRRKTSVSLFTHFEESKIQWYLNDKHLKDKINEFKPDVLFHCAWSGVRGNGRNDSNIQIENIKISKKLFELYPYKQIIAIGSQAEYGYYRDIVSEKHQLNPILEYGKAKVKCSDILKSYCEEYGIEWQWIRIFTVFGEKQTGGLIKNAIEKCIGGGISFPTTKGEQRYSYLYAEDFAQAVCNMIGSKGKSGIYNLSQPKGLHSNREILEHIKELTKSDIHFDFGAIPYSEEQVMLMDGGVDKFERAFGRIPYTDFEKALTNTIYSFRSKK